MEYGTRMEFLLENGYKNDAARKCYYGQWNSFFRAEKERNKNNNIDNSQQATSEKRDKWENYKCIESESLDYFHCNLMRLSNQLAFCLLKNNVECLFFEN